MKRFIVSIICITVFCVGLGAIVEKVGARFKSDEKALALIRQARIAIGGEPSLVAVRSMVIRGTTMTTFTIGSEVRSEAGETEIAMQLPDKLSKTVKIGRGDDPSAGEHVERKHDIVIVRSGGGNDENSLPGGEKKVWVHKSAEGDSKVVGEPVAIPGGHKVIIRTDGGEARAGEFTSQDGKTFKIRTAGEPEIEKIVVNGDGDHLRTAGLPKQNELLRTALSLLLTAPEGIDVSYTFAGEGDVDGTSCNIVNASFGGSDIKLYLSKVSSLPVMVSYMGMPMPQIMHFKMKAPEGGTADKNVMFERKMEAPAPVEYNVRFSDYRSVSGVQLPFKWTTTIGGQPGEVFDVTGYEINPANIAEKFQNQKVMVRTKAKDSN